MSEIRAVIFDADGVLINPTWLFANHLKEVYGLDRATTRDFFGGPFLDCLNGKADLFEELPRFIVQWKLPLSTEQFVETWFELEKTLDQRLIAEIKRLRDTGVPCYLATNQEKWRARFMLDQMGIGTHFDDVFFSYALGCRKPSPEYYKEITNRIGVPPAQILFFDDSLEFLEGAKQIGWRTVHYLEFENLDEGLLFHGMTENQ